MKREFADQYVALENDHWWFRARRVILKTLLDRDARWRPDLDVLEVGVGPGINLYSLYPPGLRLVGLEPDPLSAEQARRRGAIPVYTGQVESMPEEITRRRFDLITLFDVLEHVADDHLVLDIVRRQLKPDGHIILSMPAYTWMWGQQDVVSLHYRRYSLGGLRRLLRQHGYRIGKATYFNTLLFFPIVATRLADRFFRRAPLGSQSDFEYGSPRLDGIMYRVFAAERHLLRFLNFPFGVSIYVMAELDPSFTPPDPA
jgi:2-polyprenyl-3-methyl-5-hydroxy-6-metoxy-1,4-benzoquinol methylase